MAVAARPGPRRRGVFALVSSAGYILNDIIDAPKDRLHPRKKERPIASGRVSPAEGVAVACACIAIAASIVWFLLAGEPRLWVAGLALAHGLNLVLYSMLLKRLVMLDVIGLALGFVLRVVAGCAAADIAPSTWLLNVAFFLAMFLAFGKRLGERRTVEDAASVRGVQAGYTDDLLRLATAVTGVVTLVTYAGYVQFRGGESGGTFAAGFNLLWLTMIPATYGMLRCIVLLDRGRYDDPTELATRDLPMQAAVLVFGALTAVAWIVN